MTQDTKDPDMVERVALKPCPYCGTAPIIIAGIIGCPECASGQPNAERWNTRTEASHHAELVEALNSIAEHKTSHPCASAWEEDRRTLVEVQDIARQYALRLAKIGGDA